MKSQKTDAAKPVVYGRKAQMANFIREYERKECTLEKLAERACVCGAAEARHQALTLISRLLPFEQQKNLVEAICKVPVSELLGYE